MTEPSGGSAKSNSGVYLWTSAGGVTPALGGPSRLITKRQELRGRTGCAHVHFHWAVGRTTRQERRAEERLNKAKTKNVHTSPSPIAASFTRCPRKEISVGTEAGRRWKNSGIFSGRSREQQASATGIVLLVIPGFPPLRQEVERAEE